MAQIKMSEIRAKFPEYGGLNDDQLLHGIYSTFYKDKLTPGQFAATVDYDTQREQLAKEAAADTGLFENFQAGVDTFLQGRDQLMSMLPGRRDPLLGPSPVTEEDVASKRRADEALAQHTGGGGFMQGVGEALPAMAIPVAGGEALAAKLGGSTLARIAGLSTAGAGAGAVSGAIAPVGPTDSRAANAVRGGVVGSVLPGALKAVGKPLGAAARKLKVFSRTETQRRAAEALRQHIPDEELPNVLRDLDAAAGAGEMPSGLQNIPTSAAQATGNPFVVQVEQATRQRPGAGGADWTNFTGDRNAAIYGNVQDMAPSEHALNLRGQIRDVNTRPLREGAQEAAAGADYETPVLAHLSDLAGSDVGTTKPIRTMVNEVTTILGDDPTPGRMYAARKWLADQLDAPARLGDDEVTNAVKTSRREARAIMQAIDDSLDAASNGQWSAYLRRYGELSRPINEGRALRDIAEEMERQPLVGKTPEVTFTKYRNALEKYGQNDYGPKLGPQAQERTQALLENMRTAEGGARTRMKSGTGGIGGSNTNIDQQLGALASDVMGAIGVTHGLPLSTAHKWVSGLNREAVEREMARIQQSPTVLAASLRALSPNERQRLVQQLVDSAAAGGAGITAANP